MSGSVDCAGKPPRTIRRALVQAAKSLGVAVDFRGESPRPDQVRFRLRYTTEPRIGSVRPRLQLAGTVSEVLARSDVAVSEWIAQVPHRG